MQVFPYLRKYKYNSKKNIMATSSSSSTLKDTLIYLRKKLERTTNDDTILQIIHKLSKIPVTLDLLQGTGAGKMMRTLSKRPGTVGEKASALLNKWRGALADSEKSSGSVKQKSSKSDFSDKISYTKSPAKEKEHIEKHSKDSHIKEKHSHVKEKYAKDKHNIDNLVKNKHSKDSHLKSKHKEVKDSHNSEKYSREKHSKEYIKDNVKEKYIQEDLGEKYEFTKLQKSSEKHRKKDSFSEENKKSKISHSNREEIPVEFYECDSIYDEDNTYNPEEVSSKNLSTSKTSKSDSIVSYEPTPKKFKSCDIESSNSSFESKSKKDTDLISNTSLNKDSKKNDSSHSSKKHSSHKKVETSSKSKIEKLSDGSVKKDKDSSRSELKKSKKALKIKTAEAFTASEVSFEDCLSFNDIVPLKKRKTVKPVSSPTPTKVSVENLHKSKSSKNSDESRSKGHESHHKSKSKSLESHHKSKTKSIESHHKSSTIPTKNYMEDEIIARSISEELVQKPYSKTQEVDLISTLPQIQPNYRPLPHKNYDSSPVKKKVMSNEEAIKFTSSRREKTAVYSGRKNCYLTEVPTLFECCTRILIENIDDIEYMGEIPFFLLESMLKRCTASQLYRIEHYNPYLLEDTNELWEVHCRRDYRIAKPEENETWRELYWRMHDEREQKLKNVTANISASIANSNPVRKAKLAYIDSVVKPPRDVARRQAKHGTALPTHHSAVKVATPTKDTSPAQKSSSPVVNVPSTSKAPRVEIFKPQKPKIAPLMAKTLKSMKQCFRR